MEGNMPRRLRNFFIAPVIMLTAALSENINADTPAVLVKLKEPGVLAVMRHAIAPGTGDPAGFTLDDCSTQRNLDDRGREQARMIGSAFREAGVVFDRVLTSQWCRCRETADLVGLGEIEDFPALNSFFQDQTTRSEQTERLREFIGSLSERERILFVTHQVNITALTGQGIASGEVFIIRMDDGGQVEVIGQFLVHP
jgi:phosphohistidine phosphatase SixA